MRWVLSFFTSAVLLFGLVAAPAGAAPITYNFTGGTITITADTSGGSPVMAATAVPLDGLFATFDAATIDLVDFEFTVPTTGTLTLAGSYGVYDEVVIESASLKPGVPYSTVSGLDLGGGSYSFAAGFVDIDGVYSASSSTGPPPFPVSNVPVPFTDDSFISGLINLNTGALQLTGITLAVLPGALFGEAEDLIVKGDVVFTGVPEPGTALLLGMGLIGMAAHRRRNVA